MNHARACVIGALLFMDSVVYERRRLAFDSGGGVPGYRRGLVLRNVRGAGVRAMRGPGFVFCVWRRVDRCYGCLSLRACV